MHLLKDLVGRKVTIYSVSSGSERQDVGVLENIDESWMRLRKSDTELLFFNIYHVRLVKPFEAH